MDVALVNLMIYVLRSSHVSPRQGAFGVLFFALHIAAIGVTASGIGVAAVAFARSLGGQVTLQEPGLAWAAAWYTTVVTVAFLLFYYVVYQIH
jgi:hypothetical protein